MWRATEWILNAIMAGCVLILIVILGILVYLLGEQIYVSNLDYEDNPSTATVTEMEYQEAYTTTTMNKVGKVLVPQTHHHSEEYNVYVEYNGTIYCIDDEDLFDSVKVGDEIKVWVHEGYNKKGELKYVYLSSRE